VLQAAVVLAALVVAAVSRSGTAVFFATRVLFFRPAIDVISEFVI
jgi:hypothetical protein